MSSFSPFKSNHPGTSSLLTMKPGVPEGAILVNHGLPFGIGNVCFQALGVEVISDITAA